MSNNLLIVESENDKFFIEALLTHINKQNIDTDKIYLNDFESLEGLSQKRLTEKLYEVSVRIEKDGLDHIGILIDADQKGIESQLSLITTCLHEVDPSLSIDEINTLTYSEKLDVSFSACITHVNGEGELETLLKAIKSADSPHADCLESWKRCLENHNKSMKQKDFDKFWVSIYNRYDCCTRNEKKQAGKKCSFEASMKKDIWDFDSPFVKDIKNFLTLFH